MDRAPARDWAAREPHLLPSYQIREAGFRLDHLIRNSLNPNANPHWPTVWRCSAIKLFLELIEEKLRAAKFANPDEVSTFIGPRLDLARAIVERTDQALIERSHPPVSSDGFRQEIITKGGDVEQIVFENPLAILQRDDVGPFRGLSEQQTSLLWTLKNYWI